MRTVARYYGRHDDSAPSFLFTVSGKQENEIADSEWELLGTLERHVNDWLRECGYQDHEPAILDCGGVWVVYRGGCGVGEWKDDVLAAYRDWKRQQQ